MATRSGITRPAKRGVLLFRARLLRMRRFLITSVAMTVARLMCLAAGRELGKPLR